MAGLVLGIGNLLLGDEGVGVHAARHLQSVLSEDDRTVVLEVGTAILDALPALEKADKVVLLDAVKADGEAGSVYRIPLGRCRRPTPIASMHGFDIFSVLSLLQRPTTPEIVVLGTEPAFIGWSMQLSPEVAGALPVLTEAVLRELEEI